MKRTILLAISLVALCATLIGYRMVTGQEEYRLLASMPVDEAIQKESGIFNPWSAEFQDMVLATADVSAAEMDSSALTLWKANKHYRVYRQVPRMGIDAPAFTIVREEDGAVFKFLGHGVETGPEGELFIVDQDFAMYLVDQKGHAKMLLRPGSVAGGMAYNPALRALAFEAVVVANDVPLRGVGIYHLDDRSWKLLAHRRSYTDMSYNLYVLWWDNDEIVVNVLDHESGLFLSKLDLEGNFSKYASFDDPSIPIWGDRILNPFGLKELILISPQSQEIIFFDVVTTEVQRFKGFAAARWRMDGQLNGIPAESKEEKMLLTKRKP